MPDEPAQPDHLAELFLRGDGVSSGAYTPHRVTLMLTRSDPVVDRVVFIHEAHHAGLNDSTAWGTALHLFARLPDPYRRCFLPLLDVCRLPHEAYATFASISVATSAHADASAALAQYPMYAHLYRVQKALTIRAGGAHRRYLAATALARLSMQTPVLERLLEQPSLEIAPSELRAIDTPNGRWRWFLREGSKLVEHAAGLATSAVQAEFGDAPTVADDGTRDPLEVARQEFDAAWSTWEHVAYAALAEALKRAGGRPLAFNEHMGATRAVISRARELEPRLELEGARLSDPAPNDAALAGATVQRVRLAVNREPWPAELTDLDGDDLVELVDIRSRVEGEPCLVLSVRLPNRLRELYSWDSRDASRLEKSDAPVVAARTVAKVGTGASVIAHACIETPDRLAGVIARWDRRGRGASVIAASCLTNTEWQRQWVDPLRELGPLIVLIDVELDRFVGSWVTGDASVQAGLIRVSDTSGDFWAVGIAAVNSKELWLAVSDELTVRLVLEQLRGTDDLRLDETTSHLAAWGDVLPSVITHLLATESFLDFAGLEGHSVAQSSSPGRPG